MSQAEARAWWADVQHLREAAERRQRHEAPRLRAVPVAPAAAPADPIPQGGRANRPPALTPASPVPDRGRANRPPALAPAQPPPARRRATRPLPPRRASARRRTVEITGRTVPAPAVPRLVEIERRRPPRSAIERVGPRPDRIAMWAPMLGFVLLLVALLSAH